MAKKIVSWVLLVLILGVAMFPAFAGAASLRYGSKGDDVVTLQTKLKRWGYYQGAADGKFGWATAEAVKNFQRKNGLTPDGVVGAATAKALGMGSTGSSGSSGSSDSSNSGSNVSKDVYLIAAAVNGEARGEPYKGQVAVAAVIPNRVDSPDFPNSIAGVVYQSGAFDAVSDGQINLAPSESTIKAARDAMNGYDPTNGCIYYYNPDTATNKWIRSRPIITTIGKHVFCK